MKCPKCGQEVSETSFDQEKGACQVCVSLAEYCSCGSTMSMVVGGTCLLCKKPIMPEPLRRQLAEADAARYFPTLDNIFAQTGLLLIVDRFRDEHPELALGRGRAIYDQWEDARQPKDAQLEEMIRAFERRHR